MKKTHRTGLFAYEQPQLTITLFQTERGFALSDETQLDDMNETPGTWL
ncbi:MAG: hypothetical protein J6B27_01300 [Alistipes sp.]|nr:hypothetical protein [Alistipes sp.]MBQ2703241.1 hypothetical protein [Alistipes sp.]MBQ3247229.1 hypothetical protein [Alistipes sp.]